MAMSFVTMPHHGALSGKMAKWRIDIETNSRNNLPAIIDVLTSRLETLHCRSLSALSCNVPLPALTTAMRERPSVDVPATRRNAPGDCNGRPDTRRDMLSTTVHIQEHMYLLTMYLH